MPHLLDQLLHAAALWPDETIDQLAGDTRWQKLIDALLEDSLLANASQIHIQWTRHSSFIRYRIEGHLVSRAEIEHRVHENLADSLKRLGRMDVCERRREQNSQMTEVSLTGERYYFEASVLPTTHLPSVVLNWRPPRAVRNLADTGLERCQLDALNQVLASDGGWVMNLRSISLGVAMLVAMKDAGRRPVRIAASELYNFPALSSMSIDQRFHTRPADGDYATWAARQLTDDHDCFVVEVGNHLIGEVIAAARQGKLVCTGFGRSLPDATVFLEYLGVNRREFVESILASVEQFTVRANCTHCAEKYRPSNLELEALRICCDRPERLVFARSKGCLECRNACPQKMTGVHEVFLAKDVRHLLVDNQPPEVIRKALLANGAIDFYTALVHKVISREIPSWVAIMQQRYLFRTRTDRERWIEIDCSNSVE